MSAPDLRGLIQVGLDVLTTTINEKTNKIMAQLGNVVGETTDTDNAEWWQHYGFASRPPKPDPKKSATQAVVLRAGDHDIVIASQDLRGLELYGNLKHGDTCVFSAGEDGLGQARSLWRGDGGITHYTTEANVAGGKAIYSRVGPGVDEETDLPDGFTWAAPWGTMKFDATGFHILHESGAQFHLGVIGGMPAPLDALTTYCSIMAATFSTTSSAQQLGAAAVLPLASSPAVIASVAALQAEVAALAAALVAVANITGPITPAHATAAAAATAAVATGAAALAPLALLTPSGTASSL